MDILSIINMVLLISLASYGAWTLFSKLNKYIVNKQNGKK